MGWTRSGDLILVCSEPRGGRGPAAGPGWGLGSKSQGLSLEFQGISLSCHK